MGLSSDSPLKTGPGELGLCKLPVERWIMTNLTVEI